MNIVRLQRATVDNVGKLTRILMISSNNKCSKVKPPMSLRLHNFGDQKQQSSELPPCFTYLQVLLPYSHTN
jgi:predicted secreted Zn-dependent protease